MSLSQPHNMPSKPALKKTALKTINLALQGGGAHGAFTWGVLDALLEDGRLEIEAVSGTSAGAMNGAVLVAGLAKGGAEQARKALKAFWRDVSVDGHISPTARALFDVVMTPWKIGRAAHQSVMDASRNMYSPYEYNPLDINPLRGVVEDHIDFKRLRETEGPGLFVAATSVLDGKLRIFTREELTADMLMASAALPLLFRAVTVNGQPYWDGGYMGNPALFPLFKVEETDDIILVQINPIERDSVPDNAMDIMERVNEITFNSPLLNEFRAIEFVARLVTGGVLHDNQHKAIRMHRIEAQERLNSYGTASKLQADWAFFTQLFEVGRDAAHQFIDNHFDDLGKRATLDLKALIS